MCDVCTNLGASCALLLVKLVAVAITVMTNTNKSAERVVYLGQHAGFTVKV